MSYLGRWLSLSLTPLILATLTNLVNSQQSYDPFVCLNSTSALGYACNGLRKHCQTYLIYRAQAPYSNASAIASLFGHSSPSLIARLNNISASASLTTRKELIVPVNCSCSAARYQSNVTYAVRSNDNPYILANATFQGLTTCDAIQNQRSGLVVDMFPGEKLTIPIRCACPTGNQSRAGIKYLMSYAIKSGDAIYSIAVRFGADVGETLQANKKSVQDSIIQPFTTLLVPLRNPPNSSMTLTPKPGGSPPSPPPASLPDQQGRKTQKWNYFLYGLIAGSGFVLIFGALGLFLVARKRRTRQVITTSATEDFEGKKSVQPLDLLESISKVAQSLKVYSFNDLQQATDNFSPNTRIAGSDVFRGELVSSENEAPQGQRLQVAIKRTETDVSREIEILNKINHANIITLLGVCFNNGLWYLVYEYAANGRLSDYIFSDDGMEKLGWERRVRIAHDAASGLDYLHGYTTPQHIHTDFRCSHVLLDSELRAKITHFGLSKTVGGGQFALTRHIIGTKGYMAPEFVEHGLITTKMDVYAFGIFIVEILTGKEAGLVCGGDCAASLSEVLGPVVVDGNDKLGELLDPYLKDTCPMDVAMALFRLAERCVRKEPSERPAMGDVVGLLSKALTSSVVWGSSASSHMTSKSDN